MKRIITLLITLCVLTGCNGQTNNVKEERIISLMPSNTEILYALGMKEEMVGVSTVDDYPKEVKNLEKFDAMQLNYEALLKAKPTIVFAHESMTSQEKVLKRLNNKGIKVVMVKDAQNFDEMYASIDQIGKAIHKEKEANQLEKKIKEDIKQVIGEYHNKLADKKVLVEVSPAPEIYTGGKGTLFDDMIHQLGSVNIFHDINGWQPVNSEAIIKRNPDVIIATSDLSDEAYKASVEKRGGFSNVNAVKRDAVYTIDADEISRPGPRIAKGLKELAETIHDAQ
ncbi:heme/hemin ABC transporter substrate-binding protein [Macrococcoides caseolyticum]|uniref:heme/hemin ABC transporter substrate-binding protein n=1 Tax=Macrococcoides caseolyticum TaxID=69966 RepID=UPI000C3290E2|nr:ABC transporter substrate-binding protein [Macrococcus caseolyticus]PKE10968.1 ABC transporter substrate-binding protein [Macrococcus caseolyticus]PKE47533.1 ABC transporter substrate-binding protein [Macrococcus caseolyticus]PKF14370.1 ABC transporter substrate-binding protein [Macrococcus caseolyticus]PNZ71877.1 ABC transporter substrate-binding protein [Macrococcus caseolyticus]QPT46210.1 ABC transporter substrate-binding protein [Macrococcus caseolyticus]